MTSSNYVLSHIFQSDQILKGETSTMPTKVFVAFGIVLISV